MMRLTEIAKSKALTSVLGHQFTQKCFVSRTAKGKGKAGQILKRSKVTTKKGSEVAKKEPPRRKSEFDEMVEDCLSSTSPLRSLKPKQKAREAEREKMGLISKAKDEELKKMNKMNKEFAKPWPIGPPGLDLISLGLVDVEKLPKYELTVEDGRRLAKEYSRVLMRKHRQRQAAETTLLRLKKEAMEALPENLKAAALIPDLTPFPVNRFMATLTPPIEGYLDKVMEAAKKSSAKEKLR
ncbi:hypothetical protein RND71_001048 [Anisodus tanguticus]|uniref:Large ribosomal subunit protein mL40 n=1 Tax=Anisodus tanguticus TaxID=243964 RepID=A0AAE1T0I3_9SOLA|nr:hypothetical protein RND71_001048 [Anisodus tanguticus]